MKELVKWSSGSDKLFYEFWPHHFKLYDLRFHFSHMQNEPNGKWARKRRLVSYCIWNAWLINKRWYRHYPFTEGTDMYSDTNPRKEERWNVPNTGRVPLPLEGEAETWRDLLRLICTQLQCSHKQWLPSASPKATEWWERLGKRMSLTVQDKALSHCTRHNVLLCEHMHNGFLKYKNDVLAPWMFTEM